MDNCILLSIRKNWAAAILSGEKKLEIRKCVPSYNPNTEKRAEYPLRVVMYEARLVKQYDEQIQAADNVLRFAVYAVA